MKLLVYKINNKQYHEYLFLNITISDENIFEILISLFCNYSSIIYQRKNNFKTII
jgi:hypothetical protein